MGCENTTTVGCNARKTLKIHINIKFSNIPTCSDRPLIILMESDIKQAYIV